jgi:hypothetical protein
MKALAFTLLKVRTKELKFNLKKKIENPFVTGGFANGSPSFSFYLFIVVPNVSVDNAVVVIAFVVAFALDMAAAIVKFVVSVWLILLLFLTYWCKSLKKKFLNVCNQKL